MIEKENKIMESRQNNHNNLNKGNYIFIPIIKDGNGYFELLVFI